MQHDISLDQEVLSNVTNQLQQEREHAVYLARANHLERRILQVFYSPHEHASSQSFLILIAFMV